MLILLLMETSMNMHAKQVNQKGAVNNLRSDHLNSSFISSETKGSNRLNVREVESQ